MAPEMPNMNEYPGFEELRLALRALPDAPGAIAELQPLLRRLAGADLCARFVGAYIREGAQLVDNERKRLAFLSSVGNSFPLFTEAGYSLSIGIEAQVRARPRETCSIPQDLVMVLITDCCVHAEVYRCDGEVPDHFDMDSRVQLVAEHRLQRGQSLFLDGARDHVMMYSDTPYVSLVLVREEMQRHLSVRHDAVHGHALYATAASQDLSRLQHVCDYLAHFGDASSRERLQELAGHRAHFIRWKATEALLNVDYGAGIAVLRRLCSDPHPDISRSAAAALVALPVQEA